MQSFPIRTKIDECCRPDKKPEAISREQHLLNCDLRAESCIFPNQWVIESETVMTIAERHR